ncbi:MAG TPA: hypothetical protein VN436_00365 [Holophaga sp.]|nr:hypothetical protein [Holophaga sp.]
MSRSAWIFRGLGMALGLGLALAELSCAGSVDTVSEGVKPVFAGSWTSSSTEDVACYWEGTTRADLPGGSTATTAHAYSPSVSSQGSIYTAGTWSDGTHTHACYWIDATQYKLTDVGTQDTYATSIALEGTTVYVGGYYINSDDTTLAIPCYWINGTRHDLYAGSVSARVTGIAVSDSAVYCSGYYASGSNTIGCYWSGTGDTNRHELTIPSSATSSKAYGIVVTDGKAYTVGSYIDSGSQVPCYWRATTPHILKHDSTVTVADAYGLTLSGSGNYVYFAGYYNNGTLDVPCRWYVAVSSADDPTTYKTDLDADSRNARARAIFASGSTVWVGGNYTNSSSLSVPCYWKDTTKTDLAGGGTGNAVVAFGPN